MTILHTFCKNSICLSILSSKLKKFVRTCSHRRGARILEHNFADYKANFRRRAVASQENSTKFSGKICRKNVCLSYENILFLLKKVVTFTVLSVAIHFFIILLIFPVYYMLPPKAVVQVPLYRLLYTVSKFRFRQPA